MENKALVMFIVNRRREDPARYFRDHRWEDDLDYPNLFTKGFRQIFWTVFSRTLEKELAVDISLMGQPYRVSYVAILDSDQSPELIAVEGQNYIISVHLEALAMRRSKFSSDLRHIMDQQGVTEAQLFPMVMDQLSAAIGVNLAEVYHHDQPALLGANIYNLEEHPAQRIPSLIYLTALYYFGRLIYWRITRDQVSFHVHDIKNTKRTFQDLGKVKLRVLNLKRFFDVKNVSNNPDIKAYNTTVRKRFALGSLYNNANAIQQSISDSIDHLDKLNNYATNRNLRLLLNITAFLTLPFTIISALMTLDVNQQIVGYTRDELFSTPSLLLIYLISIGLPVSMYLILATPRWWRNWRTRSR